MTELRLPWLELAIAVPLLGSLVVSRQRDPLRASRWGVAFTGLTLALTLGGWVDYAALGVVEAADRCDLLADLFGGRRLLVIDELSAPLLSLVALLHFLTALATARTKMRRYSFASSLFAEAVRLATFSCEEPWVLIALLAVGVLPPYFELRSRAKPTRVYVLHMGLFVALMVLGWSLVEAGDGPGAAGWATVPLLLAVLLRSGVIPVHCWLTDLFEHATFGSALLFVSPIAGVYLAVRLVLPVAPGWALQLLGLVSLSTAVYAAGMATVQREVRRFFAYLFLSHSALVLVGLELIGADENPAISLTGALSLWIAVALALGGFGLTLRALEARFGRLPLVDFHGLYDHSPTLAVCFLLTGLASVGFPGTLGFVAGELLVDGAVEANVWVGLAVVLAAALNGIAVVRAYFLLFTGTRHVSSVPLNISPQERFAVLTLAALILGGGFFPQLSVATRYQAARDVLAEREKRHPSHTARPHAVEER